MKKNLAYLDTSTYIKLYIKESGSEEARQESGKNRILSSAILPVECFSALSRKRQEGTISAKDLERLAGYIRKDLLYIEIIRLTDEVLRKAEDITLHGNARTMDAVHIAAALIFQEAIGTGITFITSDKKQQTAAEDNGLTTLFVG